MLKVGDKVKFLNAVGGGVITGFLSPKVANVKDDEGFEVPVMVSELVKNVRYVDMPVRSAREAAKAPVQEVKKPKKETQPLFASSAGNPASTEAAWFLAFVPEVPTMPLSGEIKAWLVNDSKFTVMYHFSLLTDGSYQSEKSGRLAPYSAVPLKGFVHQDLSNLPEFGIQLLPFDKSAPSLKPALVKTLRVNPVKLYKETSYVANNYFDKRVMLVDIREKDMSKELEKLKQHDFSAPAGLKEPEDNQKTPAVKKEPADLKEVDLHIGELVESYSGLSNKEILDIQMERFTSELEAAIKKGIRRIVFIHGVGQGTLKNELRRVLSATYKKYDVQDASFREYGYGATMVILKRG